MALCRGLGRSQLFLLLRLDSVKTARRLRQRPSLWDADTLHSRKIFWTIVLPGGSRASASIQSIAEQSEHRQTSRAAPNIQSIREHRRASRVSANIQSLG